MKFRTIFRNEWAPIVPPHKVRLMTADQGWLVIVLLLTIVVELWWFLPPK